MAKSLGDHRGKEGAPAQGGLGIEGGDRRDCSTAVAVWHAGSLSGPHRAGLGFKVTVTNGFRKTEDKI